MNFRVKRSLLLAIAAGLLAANAAYLHLKKGEREISPHVIEWDAASIARCTFKLDGSEVGNGHSGFNAIVKRIAQLPEGTFLVFKVPNSVMSEYVRLYDSVDSLPIGNDADARLIFHRAIDGKISELNVR